MTKIEVFDTEAERIEKLTKLLDDETAYGEAFVMEAIFDCLDREAKLYGTTAELLVAKYMS